MTDRKLLTHRPFRIWHCLCARDRYGGVHSSSAGSRVSELTDTPNLASSYCPRCEPERDPVHEILTVCWCEEHRPTCEGADDARAIVGGGVLVSVGVHLVPHVLDRHFDAGKLVQSLPDCLPLGDQSLSG